MAIISSLFRKTGIALLCTGLAVGAGAQAPNPGAALPTDPSVIKGKLPNGLTYYIRPNEKPKQKVELRLIVKAGSILEDDQQLGLAHFMEHMNFNGLKNFEKNELVSYLQSIGVEFGADLNAYTGFDQTVYILPIPTDKPGNLDKGFQIIEDWAHNALLTDKDINDERGVVLEESRMGKGADMRMLDKYFPKVAGGTLYAKRLPIGKDEILKSFKPETIRRFYADWYRPSLQAVAIVGDIDSATAMAYLQKHFAGLKDPASARPRTQQTVTPRTKPEAMVVTDKEASSTQLALMYPYQKASPDKTLGEYRASIVRNLAIQIVNQRLGELAESADPPFPYAGVSFDNFIQGYESFNAATTFGAEGPQKAMNALAGELIKAKQYGFTQAELDRAGAQMKNFIEKAYNERKTTNSSAYVEEYVRNFLEDEAIPGIENELNYYKTFLPTITLAEVNAEPKEWMKNDAVFTLITGPESLKGKLPADAALVTMTSNAFKQTVKENVETAVSTELLSGMPKKGEVTSTTKDEALGTTTFTLSNNMKVTIKATDFKSDEILLSGKRKGGLSRFPLADRKNAEYASNVVDAMGLGTHTPTDLEKMLSGKTVSANLDFTETEDVISASSSIKDFETMLQVLHLSMTAPRVDEGLFKGFVGKSKQMYMFIGANPQAAFVDTTMKVLYNNSPYAPSPFPKPADFDKIDMAKSVQIYKDNFGNPSGFHLFLVGNMSPETAKPLLETYLGSLTAKGATPSIKDNGLRPIAGKTMLKVLKGKEKQSLIVANYNGAAAFSEDLLLRANAVTELLNIKVIEELREKLGGIYTGGYYAQVTKEPYPHYSVVMQMPCGPENVDKLLAAATAVIDELKAKGPSATDLDKVKTQWKEARRTAMRENKFWSTKLADIMMYDRSKDHLLEYEKWVDSLTPAEIQATAKMLFDGKNEFVSVLYPEGS